MVSRATVRMRSQPVYEAAMRQTAGPYWPILLSTFLVIVCVHRPEEIIQSAITEKNIEHSHMAR